MEITSPITNGKTRYINSLSTLDITHLYKKYCDVSRFFVDLPKIDIYECCDTGYRFYYPFTIAGDGAFYEDLSKEPLYYVPWKWEHEIVSSYITAGTTVLEQGCATGAFLKKMKDDKEIIAYGTEINEEAKATAKNSGVLFDTCHSADLVCSFQVLEHIADVHSFIEEAINAAKPGAYIMFSVPNNDGFLKDDKFCFLNMPPHHMGLWKESVFKKLPNYYPLDFITAHSEHLQPNHYRSYYQIYYGDILRPFGFLGKVINKIIFTIIAQPIIALRAKKLPGHTIVAVFKKHQ